ncbi:MAG: helix-turn-helix domain-containing protein [Candidatus Sulfotelmatobacter sp.]
MSRLGNPKDAISALADVLRGVHKPYAGARFRAAFLKEDSRFLTGSVVFCPEEAPSRPTADYGPLILSEQWQGDWGEALGLLSRVLSGQAGIGGQQIKPGFDQSDLDHRPSIFGIGTGGWSGWEMRSYYNPGPNAIQPLLHNSILGFGLRPYRGGDQAINDWVFDVHTDNTGGNVPNLNSLVTFLPDTRGRVVSALWTPGKLNLSLEINIPSEQVELQILQLGSARLPQISRATSGTTEFEIPDDCRELLIYLVYKEGDCIMSVHLRSVYESFGHVPEELIAKSRAASDLGKGEGDQIEFKPFISPNDAKETEIIDTVVAFANTSGGRIYVGVNDRDASPQGTGELWKVFKGSGNDALKAQADRLRSLIANRIAPTPRFLIEEIRVFEAPMVAITVEPGNQTYYECGSNEVWVRRGSSNVRPRPDAGIHSTVEEFGA